MPAKEYDVLIVGSGHSGGMAANILTKQGINCLMLNAGPESDFEHNRVNKAVHDLPYRGFGKPGRLPHVYQANEFNANQWVDETENPVHARSGEPVQLGARAAGGRAVAVLGAAIVPPERFRIQGGRPGRHRPELADQPGGHGPVLFAGGRDFPRARGARKDGRNFPTATSSSPTTARIARPSSAWPNSAKQRGMKFSKMRSSGGQNGLASSVNLLLPDAMATGKLEMVSNAIVREITTDKKTGLANGAHFVDRHSRHERAREGARRGAGGGNAGKHAAAAELRDRELERRAGALSARSDLRHLGGRLRARSARRQASAGTDGRQRVHPALPQSQEGREARFHQGLLRA